MKNVLCIFSAGHSGSTLISLMVGAHSKAFYLGEFHVLARWCNENKACGCGKLIRECSFWRDVRDQYKKLTGLDFFTHAKDLLTYERYNVLAQDTYIWKFQKATAYLGNAYMVLAPFKLFTNRRWRKLIKTSMRLYKLVSDLSRSEILVDSTKSYIRLYNLYSVYPDLIKIIWLVRDGKAVCHSNIRKRGFSMKRAARAWRNTYVRGETLLSLLPDESKLFVRYEELCMDPEKYAKRIADFLSVSFENSMLDIAKGVGHSIAGNIMKKQLNNAIILNEEWKDDLSLEELECFDKIAGHVNHRYGYFS